MTRTEAIEHIWQLSMQVSGEFCCSNAEREDLERETSEAIAVLTGSAAAEASQ